MKLILISPNGAKQYYAAVDDEDFEWLSKLTWTSTPNRNGCVYALHHKHTGGSRANRKLVEVGMHRMIMNAKPGESVDHIDGNGLNNQKINLRVCTHRQNSHNRKSYKGSTSKYVGVSRHVCKYNTKNGVRTSEGWLASIVIDGKKITIGRYLTEIDAAKARDRMAKKHYGEFANINIKE